MDNIPDILLLSYVGDAVFELIVREMLVKENAATPFSCNKKALGFVSAPMQARGARRLISIFTPEENDVFRRGKNAKSASNPRNTSIYTYRLATGLEAVFGYNHLSGNDERNRKLFEYGFLTSDA